MKTKSIVITFLGLVFLLMGFYLLHAYPLASKTLFTAIYISIGIGFGLFGQGIGELYQGIFYKKCPDIEKQMNIEIQDERNLTILYMAKAKAFDMTRIVFGILLFVFLFLQAPLEIILFFASAYIFVMVYGVYARVQIEKKL